MKNLFPITIKFLLFLIFGSAFFNISTAQQLPNAGFEQWNSSWNNKPQPDSWNLSNVEQIGLKFNIGERSTDAHSGQYSVHCVDTEVGALGITAVSPSWVTLGTPWAYLEGIKVGSSTAGTYGGIQWTFRPDSLSVWIKRQSAGNEDMNLVYYSWTGEAINNSYGNKDKGCTTVERHDEESDICLSDLNECKAPSGNAVQIAQGWLRARTQYSSWTEVKVPIKYFSDNRPEKMNIILSASNYPNKRANDGLYTSSHLWIDDVSMVYSSKIYEMIIDGYAYTKFNKDKTEYFYELDGDEIPDIVCKRSGRTLSGSEISIVNGTKDGNPTVITVKAEDGSSTTTYTIHYVSRRDIDPYPVNILINGVAIDNFNKYKSNYGVTVPYGTTEAPKIEVVKSKEVQTYKIEPFTIPGTAKITVYAENDEYFAEYLINFSIGKLSDTTLQDIQVNGVSISGFNPTKTIYTVNIPIGTTDSPVVTYTSKYPEGSQTVDIKVVEKDITGFDSIVHVSVSAPAATSVRVYELRYKIAPSSYSYLKNLTVDGFSIEGFKPDSFSYKIIVPYGTTEMPAVDYEKGESCQTVDMEEGHLGGTTKITVTAQDKIATSIYRVKFDFAKSDNTHLKNIFLDGSPLESFNPEVNDYTYKLSGSELQNPVITVEKGDVIQHVVISQPDFMNKSEITVTSEVGTKNVYTLRFSKTNASSLLSDIKLDGISMKGFSPEIFEYTYIIDKQAVEIPNIEYEKADEAAMVLASMPKPDEVAKFTVISQNNDTSVYIIRFVKEAEKFNTVTALNIDGTLIDGFDPMKTKYIVAVSEEPKSVTAVGGNALKTLDNISHKRFETPDNADGKGMVYDIWFHYETDIIPNSDFEQWTTPKYTNIPTAVKPLGWNCPADVVGEVQLESWCLLSIIPCGSTKGYAGYEINNIDNKTVGINTTNYQCTLAGPVPAVLSLGSVFCSITCASGSEVGFSGGITFRNTPDVASIKYKYPNKANEGALFAFRFFEDSNEIKKDVLFKNETSDFQVYNHPLNLGDAQITKMNIAINPNGNTWSGLTALNHAEVDVDYIKFIYSSKISAIKVNGVNATITGTDAKATIDSNYSGVPVIDITGEVEDQMYDIKYGDEVLGERIVKIISYAEDSTYTEYTLTITRPNANLLLSDLRLDGNTIEGFDKETFEYNVELPVGANQIPDILAVAGDVNQVVTMTLDSMTAIVEVASTNAASKNTYIINFSVAVDETDLKMIKLDDANLDSFSPDVYEYMIILPMGDKIIPLATVEKWMDEQKVEILASEDRMYQEIIVRTPGVVDKSYILRYEYTLSNNAFLKDILVGDDRVVIPSFDSETFRYTVFLPYKPERLPEITPIKGDEAQTVDVKYAESISDSTVITVTSEDMFVTNEYVLTYKEAESDVATLEMIYYNDIEVEGFERDSFEYEIELPIGTEKEPNIGWNTTEPDECVSKKKEQTNNGWKITITAEAKDGVNCNNYVLTFTVRQESRLKDIKLFGKTIDDFDKDVFSYELYMKPYSTLPTLNDLEYTPMDENEKITVTSQNNVFEILVVSGVDSTYNSTYTVKSSVQLSNNTDLISLSYDGVPMKNFSSNIYEYSYKLHFGIITFDEELIKYEQPEGEQGQEVRVVKNGLTAEVQVTAQDGTHSKYIIYFETDSFDTTQEPTADMVCVTSTADGCWKFSSKCTTVAVVLSDFSGKVKAISQLTPINPNFELCSPEAEGFVYKVPRDQIVIYNFIYAQKKKINSGKVKGLVQ